MIAPALLSLGGVVRRRRRRLQARCRQGVFSLSTSERFVVIFLAVVVVVVVVLFTDALFHTVVEWVVGRIVVGGACRSAGFGKEKCTRTGFSSEQGRNKYLWTHHPMQVIRRICEGQGSGSRQWHTHDLIGQVVKFFVTRGHHWH